MRRASVATLPSPRPWTMRRPPRWLPSESNLSRLPRLPCLPLPRPRRPHPQPQRSPVPTSRLLPPMRRPRRRRTSPHRLTLPLSRLKLLVKNLTLPKRSILPRLRLPPRLRRPLPRPSRPSHRQPRRPLPRHPNSPFRRLLKPPLALVRLKTIRARKLRLSPRPLPRLMRPQPWRWRSSRPRNPTLLRVKLPPRLNLPISRPSPQTGRPSLPQLNQP